MYILGISGYHPFATQFLGQFAHTIFLALRNYFGCCKFDIFQSNKSFLILAPLLSNIHKFRILFFRYS